MLIRTSLALMIALAACSSSSSNTPDSNTATVMAVTCPPGATLPTIATDENTNAFTPSTTSIGVGEIVKFAMSASHNVAPDPHKATDAGLVVGLGATACLMFTKAGTFNFECGIHLFEGAVTVQ